MRKIVSLLLLSLLCSMAMAQDAIVATGCLLCRSAQMSAAEMYSASGGRYKPPHKPNKWSKIMNFYKPKGDEAGDREGFNVHELGRKQIYFGIALGINGGDYKVTRTPFSSGLDTIKTVKSSVGPGFNLGIITNWQFHRYFDLRLIPTLSFSDRSLNYTTILRTQPQTSKTISSIYLDFPLQVRFKSDPIKNTRVFVIAGIRYDYDLASNENTKVKDILKVRRNDLAVDYGVGLMIYFPYFIMSPEFKVSNGILNVNSPSQGYIYSNALQKLFSRTFTFTLNLEG